MNLTNSATHCLLCTCLVYLNADINRANIFHFRAYMMSQAPLDSTFVPLRNTPKRKLNDSHDNLMAPYTKNSSRTIEQRSLQPFGEDADSIRDKFGIEVTGNNCPLPIQNFDEIGLPTPVLHYLKNKKKFKTPTPIQMQGIGALISGRDTIGLSETGSGKSLAYLLPMCLYLQSKTNASSVCENGKAYPRCLILVPTRELVNQVCEVAKELVESLPQGVKTNSNELHQNVSVPASQPSNSLSSFRPNTPMYPPIPPPMVDSSLFGSSLPIPTPFFPRLPMPTHFMLPPGCSSISDSTFLVNGGTQNNYPRPNGRHCNSKIDAFTVLGVSGGTVVKDNRLQLKDGVHVLVATPGRLIDLCERGWLSLERVSYFVIDECDKSLEMGLEEQLRKIIAMVTIHDIPRQTSMWSATLPDSLERLARSAVLDPIYISTGAKDSIPRNIEQNVIFLHSYQKDKKLLDSLRQTPYPPVIIFTNTISAANEVASLLVEEQFHVAVLHSEREQEYRNKTMTAFRNGRVDVLVATDLASRGLDIPDVTHVINYDIPDSIEDYIHRCGRTGRFGRRGLATSFLTLECRIAKELKELLESTSCELPIQLQDIKNFGRKVVRTSMGDRIDDYS